MPGYIYVIHAEGTSRYKIGKTQSQPSKRMKELQTGSPYRLRLVDFSEVDNMESVESAMHERYKAYRVNGEWFDLPDVQVVIDDLRGIRVQENTSSSELDILEQLYHANDHLFGIGRTLESISHELSRLANAVEAIAGTGYVDDGAWWNSVDFEDVTN